MADNSVPIDAGSGFVANPNPPPPASNPSGTPIGNSGGNADTGAGATPIGNSGGNADTGKGGRAIGNSGGNADLAAQNEQPAASSRQVPQTPDADYAPQNPLDSAALARQNDYSWTDIDTHLAMLKQSARDFGYSDAEINQQLGYRDPKPMQDRMTFGLTTQLANDPEQMLRANEPLKPDQPSPVDFNTDQMRGDYSRALLSNEVVGPQDFSDHYAARFQEAYSNLGGNPTVVAPAVDQARQALQGALPTAKELTDVALGFQQQTGAGGAGGVGLDLIRQNLMNRWVDTGDTPMQTWQKAQTPLPYSGSIDQAPGGGYSDLFNQMTSPPPAYAEAWRDPVQAMVNVAKAIGGAEGDTWSGFGTDLTGTYDAKTGRWNGGYHELFQFMNDSMKANGGDMSPLGVAKMTSATLAALGMGAVDVGAATFNLTNRLLPILPILAGGHQLLSELFDRTTDTPEGSREVAQGLLNSAVALGPLFENLAASRTGLMNYGKVKVELPSVADGVPPVPKAADLFSWGEENPTKGAAAGSLTEQVRPAEAAAAPVNWLDKRLSWGDVMQAWGKVTDGKQLVVDPAADEGKQWAQMDLLDTRPGAKDLPNVNGTAEFTTAKGSVYTVEEDGTTTRNKSFHPEHGEKDQGPQPKSEQTFYVNADQANALGEVQAQGGAARKIAQASDGRWGMQYTDGPNAGKFESRTMVDAEHTPRVGLTPVELWNEGKRVHFGNEITEVKLPEEGATKIGERVEAEGLRPNDALQTVLKEVGEGIGDKPLEKVVTDAGIKDPNTIELAKAYDASSSIWSIFHNLMVDQAGGSLKSFYFTTESLMEKSNAVFGKDFAKAIIRQKYGLSEQLYQMHFAALEGYRKDLEKFMPAYEKAVRGAITNPAALDANPVHQMVRFIEGRSAGTTMDKDSKLYPIAEAVRNVYQNMREQIEREYPGASFYEDYFRHRWIRPEQADRAFPEWSGKQGDASSLKRRSIPTIAEGLEKGLMPVDLNPITNTLAYVQSMAQHLAAKQVLDTATLVTKADGTPLAVWAKQAPVGYSALPGKLTEKITPYIDSNGKPRVNVRHLYGMDGFAGIYKNWIDKGVYANSAKATIYNRLLYSSNTVLMLKLGLPFYHAIAMSTETAIASIANGMGELMGGDLLRGLKDIGSGITVIPSVAETTYKGIKFQKDYLQKDMNGNPVASMFAQAGGRGAGGKADRAQVQFRYGAAESLLKSWSRGSLGNELLADVKHIFPSDAEARSWPGTPFRAVGFAAHELGRAMNTVTGWLFNHAIPWLKMGAFANEFEAWMRRNPTSTQVDQLNFARQVHDRIENTHGELNQNLLFWPALTKQILNLGLVSLGWEYGSLRAIANAAQIGNINPTNPEFIKGNLSSFRWALGFIVGSAANNAIIQYLHTRTLPGAVGTPWQDLMNPLLSTTPSPPEKGQVGNAYPRGLAAGYGKDIFRIIQAFMTSGKQDPWSMLQNVSGIAGGKANPFLGMLWTTAVSGTYRDADGTHTVRNQPIIDTMPNGQKVARDPRHDTVAHEITDSWWNYWRHVYEPALTPISLENTTQAQKAANPLSTFEKVTGAVRLSPRWVSNPTAVAASQTAQDKNNDKTEMGRANKLNQSLATPDKIQFPATGGPSATELAKRAAQEENRPYSSYKSPYTYTSPYDKNDTPAETRPHDATPHEPSIRAQTEALRAAERGNQEEQQTEVSRPRGRPRGRGER